MTIVVSHGRYYLPIPNGFKEISKAEALELHEKGAVTEVENYERD